MSCCPGAGRERHNRMLLCYLPLSHLKLVLRRPCAYGAVLVGYRAHHRVYVTKSALIRSRLRAQYRKIFAKMDYCKTICPEPASAGLCG